MEQPGVVARNFALSFSLNFLSIFVHFSGSIGLITLIWALLERFFPAAEVEYRGCQFCPKVMTSEEEERPRLVTAGYGRHRSQWVKDVYDKLKKQNSAKHGKREKLSENWLKSHAIGFGWLRI